MQAIQAQNNLNDTVLTSGQLLMIPAGNSSIPPASTFPYVVQSGDSLYLIARRFNLPYESVLTLNPLSNPNLIYPGQVVYLPLATTASAPLRSCPEGTTSYVIQPGDTLASIALRYGIGIQTIMRYNTQISNQDEISAGDTLCLPQNNACPEGSFAYIVKSGDSISRIANEFQIGIEQLTELNPSLASGNLIVGQLICIPEQQSNACPDGFFSYIIQPGDTIYHLAQLFGTSVEAIAAANPQIDPDLIYVGRTLCIPERRVCGEGTFAYVIQPGDTVYRLAQRFETTVADILQLNPGLDPMRLATGQTVCIPEVISPIVCPAGSSPYVTQENDTLASLALRQHVRPEAIELINPDVDFARLEAGMALCLPTMAAAQEEPIAAPEAEEAVTEEAVTTAAAAEPNPEVVATSAHLIIETPCGCEEEEIEKPQEELCEEAEVIERIVSNAAPLFEEGDEEEEILDAPPNEELPELAVDDDFEEILAEEDAAAEGVHHQERTEVGPPRAPSFRTLEAPETVAQSGAAQQSQATPLQVRRCPAGAISHTIQQGDTLASLATRYQTTVPSIQALNPEFDPLNLPIGSIICIPSIQNMSRYVVLIGDTLYLIARRFGLTIEQIMSVNPQISDPNRIFPGQIIWIPV